MNNLSSSQGHLAHVFNGQQNFYTYEFSANKNIFYTTSLESYKETASVLMWNINSNDFLNSFEDDYGDGTIFQIKEVGEKYLLLITCLTRDSIDNDRFCIKIWDIKNESLITRVVINDNKYSDFL